MIEALLKPLLKPTVEEKGLGQLVLRFRHFSRLPEGALAYVGRLNDALTLKSGILRGEMDGDRLTLLYDAGRITGKEALSWLDRCLSTALRQTLSVGADKPETVYRAVMEELTRLLG